MEITKQDGQREPFNPSKLENSLKRAGCSKGVCEDVISEVEQALYDGESTSEIYKKAFALLREKERPLAARYSMKRALLDLGPSGFPFEDFVAEIFRAKGFSRVETGKQLDGVCAPHELDMYGFKGETCVGAELKFHNGLGVKTDLKAALYVQARFQDIKSAHPTGHVEGGIDEMWLITNTAFTSNARAYGACVGLKLISWEYPKRGNLQDLIEEAGVQPITALTTLSGKQKRELLHKKLVLCRSLMGSARVLQELGLSKVEQEAAAAEARALCG